MYSHFCVTIPLIGTYENCDVNFDFNCFWFFFFAFYCFCVPAGFCVYFNIISHKIQMICVSFEIAVRFTGFNGADRVLLDHCTFKNNRGYQSGGALEALIASFYIQNTIFENSLTINLLFFVFFLRFVLNCLCVCFFVSWCVSLCFC